MTHAIHLDVDVDARAQTMSREGVVAEHVGDVEDDQLAAHRTMIKNNLNLKLNIYLLIS